MYNQGHRFRKAVAILFLFVFTSYKSVSTRDAGPTCVTTTNPDPCTSHCKVDLRGCEATSVIRTQVSNILGQAVRSEISAKHTAKPFRLLVDKSDAMMPAIFIVYGHRRDKNESSGIQQ